MFEPVLYKVIKINGDYAILHTVDGVENTYGVENTIAMALLPIEICEGDSVLYEFPDYRIIS